MNKRLISLVAILGTFTLVGAGCYSKSTTITPVTNTTTNVTTTNTGTSSAQAVSIQGFAFNPSNISVKVGTQVTWTNNDSTSHTITGNNGGPASGTVAPGGTYSYTFATAGTFSYHCNFHSSMTGTVTVTQ